MKNFKSLDDLVAVATEEGVPAILDECGVKGMGDKNAIRKVLSPI